MSRGELKLFACRSGEEFAQRILSELNNIGDLERELSLGEMEVDDFRDGDCLPTVGESVRGADVYVVQCCYSPSSPKNLDGNFMELIKVIRAMNESGAHKVTAVMPYHPYARQDKREGRQLITARLAADMLKEAGTNDVFVADVHAAQIAGFYTGRIHMDDLKAHVVFLPYVRNQLFNPERGSLLSSDAGSVGRTEFYGKQLGTREIAQAFKTRPKPGEVSDDVKIAGYVTGKDVLVVDDIIDSGNTLEAVGNEALRKGARSLTYLCTHPLMTDNAVGKMRGLNARVIGTDSIIHGPGFMKENGDFYTEISIAPLFAHAIFNLNHDCSVSDLYNGTKTL